ncbi:MAG: DciA family protein [Kiritimatiellia bacterium]
MPADDTRDPRKLPRLSASKAELYSDRFQTEGPVQRPSPHREAHVSAWLAPTLRGFGIHEAESIHRVRRLWPAVAGPVIAPRTFAARLTNGLLTVHVEFDLARRNRRLGRMHLVARAKAAGLSDIITAVRLQVGPLHDENQGR